MAINQNMVIRIFSLTCSVILLAAVGNIDTSGISMLEETKKMAERRELQVIISLVSFANHEPNIFYSLFIVASLLTFKSFHSYDYSLFWSILEVR